MTTAVATTPNNTMAVAEQYLESFGNKLTKHHRNQFLNICQEFGLNPFAREIYGIPFGDKFNIIVGYEVYLKRAETSGQLAGWRSWTEGEGKQMKGCIEIARKDWNAPFYHEVYLAEYDQNNTMWKSKPMTMIKKVAIAQGMRLAFPVELGGMPYTSDEISTEPQQQIQPETNEYITRTIAQEIVGKLDAAEINQSAFLHAFKVDRFGMIKKAQMPEIETWISKNVAEIVMTSEEIEDVTPPANEQLQTFYALITQLAERSGDSPDDTLSNLTHDKLTALVDLEDKSPAYLNDIKMMVEAALEKEG